MARESRKGGLTVAWRAIWKQLSAAPSVMLTIFAACLIVVVFLASIPRYVEQISNDALQETLVEPPVTQRNIAASRAARFGASVLGDPFRLIRERGDRFLAEDIPASVQPLVADHTYFVESPEFAISPLPGEDTWPFPTFLKFRFQERLEEHSELVEGRAPELHDPLLRLDGSECPEDLEDITTFEEDSDVDCVLQEIPVYEVAVTRATLDTLGFGLEEMVSLRPNPEDPYFRAQPLDELDFELILTISGIIELADSSLDYWYGDEGLHRSGVNETADFRLVFATGAASVDAYRPLFSDAGRAPWFYQWRYFIDPELVEAATVGQVSADLRNLQVEYSSLGGGRTTFAVATQLPNLIDRYLGQRQITIALMSIALAGVFAIGITLIMELAGLATIRHRSALVLTRNRGSSRSQLLLTRLYQGVLVVGPSAVLGYLAAQSLVSDTDSLVAYRATVAFAAASILVFVTATAPVIVRRLGALQRTEPAPERRGGVRTVLEVLLIVVAFGSLLLLRRRAQADTVETLTFDPLLALAPSLAAAAIGAIVVRVYPLLARAAAGLIARGRSLVGFFGLRRILSQPPVARIPLVVILIAAAISVFAVVVRASIDEGREAFSWQTVGADYRVTGTSPGRAISAVIDLDEVDEIENEAIASRWPSIRPVGTRLSLEFLAIDGTEYQAVVAGTAGDPDLPDFLFVERGPGAGTEQAPLPVIASSQGWRIEAPPRLGETLTVVLGPAEVTVVVEEIRDSFPSIAEDRAFLVADIGPIQQLAGSIPITPTDLYLSAPRSAEGEISSTIERQTRSARLYSRYGTLSAVADTSFAGAIDDGLTVTVALATAFAAVAAVSSLALSSAVRRRDLGYLRTMGLVPRQSAWITIIEQLPLVLIATAVGGLTGIGVVLLMRPAIQLEAFTGGLAEAPIVYDWPAIVVASLVFAIILAIALVIFVVVNRSDDLGRLLRVGDE